MTDLLTKLIRERDDLQNKVTAMGHFIAYNNCDDKFPVEHMALLLKQQEAMQDYLVILCKRIELIKKEH